MKLGERLRKLRNQMDMTLDDISKRTRVGKATLSRIENGITNGTFNTHIKICQALGIDIKELYEGLEAPKGKAGVVDSTQKVETHEYNDRVYKVILAKDFKEKNMLPQLLVVEVGGRAVIERSKKKVEKFIYCFEGIVDVILDNDVYQLKKGKSIYFDSSTPHSINNTGKTTAKCLVVSSPVEI